MAKRIYGYRAKSKGKPAVDQKAPWTSDSIQAVLSNPVYARRIIPMETSKEDSVDAETVRKILDLFLSGVPAAEIAQRLNADE